MSGPGPSGITSVHATDPSAPGRHAKAVPGRDTVTFPAIRDDAPEKCTCGTSGCPDRDRTHDVPMPADPRVLPSCGPGVVSKIWRMRVRNGEWDDIRALFRKARKKVQDAADEGQGAIHNNLDCDWHDIAAVFRANTGLLTDPLLSQSLRQMESVLAGRLEEDRRRSEERWGMGNGVAA